MAKKICNICNERPVSKIVLNGLCDPCREEGEWENAHSDHAHEDFGQLAEAAKTASAVELRKLAPKAGIRNAGQHKSAELRTMIAEAIEEMQHGCWICHPELNEARMTVKSERPSRKGQVINVPLRAPGEIKAAVVQKRAPQAQIIVNRDGTVKLDLTTPSFVLILAWDVEGGYDYPNSVAVVAGKKRKVRNVAEALRLIAAN